MRDPETLNVNNSVSFDIVSKTCLAVDVTQCTCVCIITTLFIHFPDLFKDVTAIEHTKAFQLHEFKGILDV